MARIRTMKPEFWQDEKLSLLDPLTRLVFLGLVSMADDAGRLVDNVKLIDGMLFPNTDDTCRDALDTLARLSRIIRYRSASGQSLIQLAKWTEHQKVDKPSRHVLPGPDTAVMVQPVVPQADDTAAAQSSRESSRESRESLARLSRSDLVPRTGDHGPRTEEVVVAARALSVRANQGLADHASRPQPIPRIIATSARSHAAAERILGAGVPLAFAEHAVYTLAKHHNADGEVKSLTYFADAVIRRWQEHAAAAATQGERPPESSEHTAPPRHVGHLGTGGRAYLTALKAVEDL